MSPSQAPASEVSVLLKKCSAGDKDAEQAVFDRTYDELRRIAHQVFFTNRTVPALQPTALVHEAFLRMPRAGEIDWQGRQHFFAIAARAMRRALIDDIRTEYADKRIHPGRTVPISDEHDTIDIRSVDDVLLAEAALSAFEAQDPRRARVVEMRVYGGMTFNEIAPVIGKSAEAAKKDWKMARLWLKTWISP
ncbi:MAG: ECF-type sigma factor [Bryobacteraceae bacterium]|nr:ECF-type sigma factor [Bryobacteraceae bacterium]